MSFELVVLGCSGSGPDPAGPASGYLIRSDATAIWVDAGTGTFMALTEWIDPAALDAIVISHLHADHCADIFGYIHYAAYRVQVATPTPLFLPPGAGGRLATFLEAGPGHAFYSVVAPIEVTSGDVVTVGDMTLAFAAMAHSVPTNGIRIEAGGRALVYSGDTGPGGSFPTLAAGADVVLCEAGLDAPRATAEYPYHLNGSEAGAIAAAADAGRLILTHLAPTLPEADIIDAAQAVFSGPVTLARPGLRVTV